jgi:methylmalonyl-CoA mutase cobalamin-binding subunit
LPLISNCDVLLICVDGNYHSIGIRALALELKQRGYTVSLMSPSLPTGEAMDLISRLKVKVLGISVGTEAHLIEAKALILAVKKKIPNCFTAIGGNGIVSSTIDFSVDFVNRPEEQKLFLDFLQSKIGTKAAS